MRAIGQFAVPVVACRRRSFGTPSHQHDGGMVGLRNLRWTGLVIALAVGVAVSACSSSPPPGSKPAASVIPEVQTAADSATSVHVAGTVTEGTQKTTVNVSFDGSSVAGTLGAYGTSFYVLSLNGASYVKLNAGFLNAEKAPASICATVCGKYVELSAGSTFQIASFLSMQQLIKEVFNSKDMSLVAASGCVFSPATRDGQSVLACRQGSGELDVAAHGMPYLVYWSGPHGQHLAFSDWNAVTPPTAPPASQVVSLSNFG
jgi:hypothetical protein